jgi:hypothetical protein
MARCASACVRMHSEQTTGEPEAARPSPRSEKIIMHMDFSGPKPACMAKRETAANPNFNGWLSGRAIQQTLRAALDAQKK